jgi:D-alanine-D-alanine ligase-like ATP-grasp enzyme
MIANNIPVVDTMVVLRREIESDMLNVIAKAEQISDYPLFTKPANLGSSVGVTKCNNRSYLQEGLLEASAFDRRVLVQKGIRNARSKSACLATMNRSHRCVAKCCQAVSFIRTNRNISTVLPG